ncbi:MAG: AMP-binding protein, partial [Chthoniobacteraceae bacterium]|nr:AMP-binding protein [Chthoniobacteraceae bacterium]
MTNEFSLTQALRRAVAIRSQKVAVIDGAVEFTWEQFADRTSRLAAAFIGIGLKPGGRVALLALNSHRSLECFYAVMQAGGVIVPLNHRLGANEIIAQTNDCSPQIIVLGAEFVELKDVLLEDPDGIRRQLVYCEGEAAPGGFHGY